MLWSKGILPPTDATDCNILFERNHMNFIKTKKVNLTKKEDFLRKALLDAQKRFDDAYKGKRWRSRTVKGKPAGV